MFIYSLNHVYFLYMLCFSTIGRLTRYHIVCVHVVMLSHTALKTTEDVEITMEQDAPWFTRSSSISITDQHHQPAYTWYHSDTSDIHVDFTPFESPSQSTLTYNQVTNQHGVIRHPLIRRVLAAAILTSFLAGLALGLMTHNNVILTPCSNQRSNPSSAKQVTFCSFYS